MNFDSVMITLKDSLSPSLIGEETLGILKKAGIAPNSISLTNSSLHPLSLSVILVSRKK